MEKLINGVLHTRDTVIVEHEGLVHMQCHKFKARAKSLGHEYDDVKSVGFIGLINAFDRFDNAKFGTRFSTFATPQIWGAIQNFLNSSNTGVNYASGVKDTAYKIRRGEMEDLSVAEIAEKLNETKGNVSWALDFLINAIPARLDKTVGDSDDNLLGIYRVFDDYSNLDVNDFLGTLKPIEQVVVTQMMTGLKASEIARMRGCEPSYIGYIRKCVRKKYLEYTNL